MRCLKMLIALSLLAEVSCVKGSLIPPVGSYSDIVLVTDTGKRGGLNDYIIKELQHQLDYYSKMEIQFKLRMISADDLRDEPPTKNMVIFGVARQGEIGRIIEGYIGTNAVRKVLEGKNHIFKKMNYPGPGQLTVIVTASSPENLRAVAVENGAIIRDIIEESNRERLRANLLLDENTALEDQLKAKYGFNVRVPSLYQLNQEKPDIPGMELVRKQPHRGLAVSWKQWTRGSLSAADSTALYGLREDLAWKMYDKDVMRRDLVFFHEGSLGPYTAVRMEGYWENSEELYGGPFICFFVQDPIRARIWIVDCLVYAPGFDKHTLLRELVSVAETFRIN